MKRSLFKSLRAELIFYVALSMFLSVITELVCGFGLYLLSTALGISYGGYGRGGRMIEKFQKTTGERGRIFNYQAIKRWDKNTLIFLMLVILFFLFLFFVMYFMLITRKLTADIDYISGSIAHMAFGDGGGRIEVRRKDEIGEIAIQINRMSEKLDALMKSEREALQANKDMITCVAHDLRTPLTSVIGYLQLATDMEKYNQEERHKYAEIAMRKANRLQGLIEELFSYTKLMSGEITLHRSEIDIVKLVEQMVEEFYPQFHENGLEYNLSQNVSGCIIYADGELMARAVQNLISNAIKYGRDGKRVFVEVEKFEKEIQIRVTNFGLIIPKESLTRIFDRFYRVEDSRSVQTGGTGLGLNIARQIVLLHDGAIKVESDTDGTCFTIALPLNMQKKELLNSDEQVKDEIKI